jgi:hypothetical protein
MDFPKAARALVRANPDADFIIISHEITRQLHRALSKEIKLKKKGSKCVVFLTTRGGDPHAGYRIGRCLRHSYPDGVKICVPSYCKSAGTLIAICADELAIGDQGELGPLDIQMRKPSEFNESSSGLDPIHALNVALDHGRGAFRSMLLELRRQAKLSTKLAGEFASQIAVGVVGPLYAQIDPNRAGELQRAMQVAYEYGHRLDYKKNLREGALKALLVGYPSHSFVIDRKEAKELFHHVSDLTSEEANFAESIWSKLEDEIDFGPHLVRIGDEPKASPKSVAKVTAIAKKSAAKRTRRK